MSRKPWHPDYVGGFQSEFFSVLDRTPFAGWRPRLIVVGSTLYLLYQTTAGGLDVRTVSAAGVLGSAVDDLEHGLRTHVVLEQSDAVRKRIGARECTRCPSVAGRRAP